MDQIQIRDLQKMSAKKIQALPYTIPIKAGDRTVGMLTPVKKMDVEKLRQVMEEAKSLNVGRDERADDEALRRLGDSVEPDWDKDPGMIELLKRLK